VLAVWFGWLASLVVRGKNNDPAQVDQTKKKKSRVRKEGGIRDKEREGEDGKH